MIVARVNEYNSKIEAQIQLEESRLEEDRQQQVQAEEKAEAERAKKKTESLNKGRFICVDIKFCSL